MSILKIHEMSEDDYHKIVELSNDENVDCLWDFPFDELDYLMETTKDMEMAERDFALIGKRLYELPEDWEEALVLSFVYKITDSVFSVHTDLSGVDYIVCLENPKDLFRAMKIADTQIGKWGSGDDEVYDMGYIEVVELAFNNANIKADFYDRVESEEE